MIIIGSCTIDELRIVRIRVQVRVGWNHGMSSSINFEPWNLHPNETMPRLSLYSRYGFGPSFNPRLLLMNIGFCPLSLFARSTSSYGNQSAARSKTKYPLNRQTLTCWSCGSLFFSFFFEPIVFRFRFRFRTHRVHNFYLETNRSQHNNYKNNEFQTDKDEYLHANSTHRFCDIGNTCQSIHHSSRHVTRASIIIARQIRTFFTQTLARIHLHVVSQMRNLSTLQRTSPWSS